METELKLLKLNLRISHTKEDDYLSSLLESVKKELENKGLLIEAEDMDQLFLWIDYAAWRYRSRIKETPLPQNIIFRLRNAKVKARVDLMTGEIV